VRWKTMILGHRTKVGENRNGGVAAYQ
jgi:hypothetical protein